MAELIDYGAYLASREWALKKEALLTRSGGICERCYNAPYQETHHKTYAHIGHESLDELLAVCSGCHQFLSAKSDVDPKVRELPPLPLPFRYASQAQGEEEWARQLACPVCRFEYVHMAGLDHDCVRDGCALDDYSHGWVRGPVLRIEMYCESGHHFFLEFGFHKGYSYLRVAPQWYDEKAPGEQVYPGAVK